MVVLALVVVLVLWFVAATVMPMVLGGGCRMLPSAWCLALGVVLVPLLVLALAT